MQKSAVKYVLAHLNQIMGQKESNLIIHCERENDVAATSSPLYKHLRSVHCSMHISLHIFIGMKSSNNKNDTLAHQFAMNIKEFLYSFSLFLFK